MKLITLLVLAAALASAQDRPLDNITSRQYQHEVRPLRIALDRWLHELGLQDAGLSIRLVKADDLPPNSCGMSNFDVRSLLGGACRPRVPPAQPPTTSSAKLLSSYLGADTDKRTSKA